MDFTKKNILVTGGGGVGIGGGIARVLSSKGATVIVNDLTDDLSQKAAEGLNGAIPLAADLRDYRQVDDMFKKIEKEVGILHGLVNNAGVGNAMPAHEIEENTFDFLYNLDVKTVWYLSRLFARHHIARSTTGHIVNVSSVQASATLDGYALYASAKAAVEGLTRGMAVELGKYGMRVNAIAPGYVHSEQGLELIATWSKDPKKWVEQHTNEYQVLNFLIQPEDCGQTVAFLLSEMSRAVTGQVIFTDNGLTLLAYSRDFIKKIEPRQHED